MLLAHARKLADLALTRKFLHTFYIADLIRVPDQRDCLGPETLNLQQLQHRRPILLQQVGMKTEIAFSQQLLNVCRHAFANPRDLKQFLGI